MQLKYIICSVLLLLIAVAISALSYIKGWNDYRMESVVLHMRGNDAVLANLEKGNTRLARSGLLAMIGGELEVYHKLSKNPLIKNPRFKGDSLSDRIEKIERHYIEATREEENEADSK